MSFGHRLESVHSVEYYAAVRKNSPERCALEQNDSHKEAGHESAHTAQVHVCRGPSSGN